MKTLYTNWTVCYSMVSFINRRNELNLLEDIYNSHAASLVVIYGRRRVGKTELPSSHKKKKSPLHFYWDKAGNIDTKRYWRMFGNVLAIRPRIDNWDDLFDLIFKYKEKLVIVFDEFQNLGKWIREYSQNSRNTGIWITRNPSICSYYRFIRRIDKKDIHR